MKDKESGDQNISDPFRPEIGRRAFLRGLAAGAAAIGTRNLACAQYMNTQYDGRKIGIALLGLGRYSAGQLGPALRKTKLCRLAGIVTGTPDKAVKWAADYQLDKNCIYNYETMDRIADNPAIDVIYVVTPPGLHAEFAIRAAKTGKHVISEKPMATSVADCDRMIRACREADVQLGIGYRLHYDPYHLEMERTATKSELGRLTKISGGFGYALKEREHRVIKELSGGGPLMDVGIYVVHGACMAVGSVPAYVTGKEEPKTNPKLFNEVEEAIRWTMEFPKGEICDGFASFSGSANHFRLEGPKGWLEINPAFNYDHTKCETSRGRMVYPAVNQQAAQMDDFASCLLEGRKTRVPGELGRRDIHLLTAIYESARTGKRVKVNP